MKASNKFLAAILSLSLAGAVLAGCTGNQPQKAENLTEATFQTEDVKTIYAATGGMPKPFTYVNEDNKLVGHNIELIEAVFDRLPQYKLELEVTDFTSVFSGLDSDRYQIGVNNFAMNEERKEKYIYSDPMFHNVHVAAVAPSNTKFGDKVNSLEELAGKSTINSVGINVVTLMENYNKTHPDNQIILEFSEADFLVQLQQVENGNYDFVLIDKPMFEFYINEYGLNLKGIELSTDLATSILEKPYSYFLVSKGNEKLTEDINVALAEVIADGTSKRINEKYFGADYSPTLEDKAEVPAPTGEVKTIYAATGGMPKPFTYVNEDNKLVGHNIELIEAVFDRLPQYKLQLEVTDFTSVFSGLDSDRYQIGVNNFAMNEERKEKYIYSDPMFHNVHVVAVAPTNPAFGDKVNSLAELAGKSTINSVGINVVTLMENYNRANPDNQIILEFSDADLLVQLQQVENGNNDFVLIDKPMFEFYIKEYGLNLKGVEVSTELATSILERPYSYFLVSKGNEKLTEDINGALAQVIADGTSKKINEKYFGADYSPKE